jgi:hypothetical protein
MLKFNPETDCYNVESRVYEIWVEPTAKAINPFETIKENAELDIRKKPVFLKWRCYLLGVKIDKAKEHYILYYKTF